MGGGGGGTSHMKRKGKRTKILHIYGLMMVGKSFIRKQQNSGNLAIVVGHLLIMKDKVYISSFRRGSYVEDEIKICDQQFYKNTSS